MTRDHGAGHKPAGATGGWKASLARVLKAHNGVRHNGTVASFATQDKRADVLYAGFKRLHELHFRMETVMSLRGKHIEALANGWHARGCSASTLHNNLSIFRTFAEWIEQILEDELAPSAAACVHQRATLVELSQLDGGEVQLFGQIRHGSDRVLVVAR
jgi:site-specific recombinase XerC